MIIDHIKILFCWSYCPHSELSHVDDQHVSFVFFLHDIFMFVFAFICLLLLFVITAILHTGCAPGRSQAPVIGWSYPTHASAPPYPNVCSRKSSWSSSTSSTSSSSKASPKVTAATNKLVSFEAVLVQNYRLLIYWISLISAQKLTQLFNDLQKQFMLPTYGRHQSTYEIWTKSNVKSTRQLVMLWRRVQCFQNGVRISTYPLEFY